MIIRYTAGVLACQQARPGRPVVLRDGSEVLIRQIQPADAALLADGSRWRPAENLAGDTELFGVAASSAANAWGVGAAIDDITGQTQPLALHCTS